MSTDENLSGSNQQKNPPPGLNIGSTDQFADQANYWSHSDEQRPKAGQPMPLSYYISRFKNWMGIGSR